MLAPVRVYADTSVFGGAFDPEFEGASRRFFDLVRQERLRLVVSATVEAEVEGGPPDVRALYREMVALSEVTTPAAPALELQAAYVHHAVVSPQHAADALHVATATVEGCAVIVSWNLKHIANFRRIPLYNAVNALHGRAPIAIHTPLEVVGDDD
jgi:predicted nucleic acid-binding protein